MIPLADIDDICELAKKLICYAQTLISKARQNSHGETYAPSATNLESSSQV